MRLTLAVCVYANQRKRQKPRDGTTAPTGSAAESAKQLMQQKRWSRRINYDVLNNLFPGSKDKPQSGTQIGAPAQAPTQEDDDDDEDEDEDEEDDQDDVPTKRARVATDWMQLGGLARPAEDDYGEDGYADGDWW